MEFVEINICPNCGGKLEEKNGQYYCLYCGRNFREEDIAEKLAEVKKELGGVVADELIKQRMEDIANARRNLYAAIHEEYIDSNKVLQYSREVKKYLSDDVQASFYETAVSSNAKAINKFLDNIDAEKYDYLAPDIIEFMIKSLEKSNVLSLKDFIDKVYRLTDNERFVEYTTRVESEAEKIDEGIYRADLPRDVFLAYSSADWKVVNEITEYLEENELRCFVALRNLRHGKGAVENYKNYLERAMHNCKCFVFISTENSCSLDCDALKVELPYMRDREPNKGRIEYASNGKRGKMTDAARILVNEFFGVEYCTDKEDVLKRVLEKITTKKVAKEQTEKYCKACGTKNYLNAKFCCECTGNEFVDTHEEYVKIKTEEKLRKEFAEKEEQAKKERERIKQEAEKEKAKLAAELERTKAELEKAKAQAVVKEQPKRDVVPQQKSQIGAPKKTTSLQQKPQVTQTAAPKQTTIPQQNPQIEVKSSSDFEIENGVLKKYKGKGGNVVIPDDVTSIGSWAFDNCENLTSIMIPNSVTSIGVSAFQDCSGLTSIEIPNGVTSIEESAFNNCWNLTKISIPSSVKNIVENAFVYCCSLTSITVASNNTVYHSVDNCLIETATKTLILGCKNSIIPSDGSVTSIGDGAFEGCSNLKKIDIPNNIISIGSWAFDSCDSLTNMTIPNGVTSIGDSTFDCCVSLTDVTIPNSVTSIGNNAFDGCSKLSSITIPNSVTSIGNNAFLGCSNLTSIEIPNSVTSIGYRAFYGCDKLTVHCESKSKPTGWNAYWDQIDCNDNNRRVKVKFGVEPEKAKTQTNSSDFEIENGVLKKYEGSGGNVVIPVGVMCIGQDAFRNCSSLTSIKISDSITEIEVYAFDGCSGLTNIEIPNSVTNIGEGAFRNCSSLTSISIPNSVMYIGSDAFDGCDKLIQIENGIKYVDKWVIDGTSYGTVPIKLRPNTVGIGESAFEECCIPSIDIPNSVKNIGHRAFFGCNRLTNIDMPNSITSIENETFDGCSSLTKIAIPDSVTSIGDYAFRGCSSLTKIEIPDSVISIGKFAFYECGSDLVIFCGNSRNSGKIFGHDWRGNAKVLDPTTDVAKQSAVQTKTSQTSIGNNADFEIKNGVLKKYMGNGGHVVIPDVVTSIGDTAFGCCAGLTSITIPNSVTSIGDSAFGGCSKNLIVKCKAKKQPSGWHKDWNKRGGGFAGRHKVIWGYKE